MPAYTVDLNKFIKDFKRVKELEKEGWKFYEYDPLYEKIRFKKLVGRVRTTRGRIREKYKYKNLGLTKEEKDFIETVTLCFSDDPKEVEDCAEKVKRMFNFIF